MKIVIRPLEKTDAILSYIWRNDPDIWKYTANKPDKKITFEIEQEWINKVIVRTNEKRFAIWVEDEMRYVGNVQLTEITSKTAQFHIFIGEKHIHGKGIGTKATNLILEYAFTILKLKKVNLEVHPENHSAIKSYKKCGFVIIDKDKIKIKMVVENNV